MSHKPEYHHIWQKAKDKLNNKYRTKWQKSKTKTKITRHLKIVTYDHVCISSGNGFKYVRGYKENNGRRGFLEGPKLVSWLVLASWSLVILFRIVSCIFTQSQQCSACGRCDAFFLYLMNSSLGLSTYYFYKVALHLLLFWQVCLS